MKRLFRDRIESMKKCCILMGCIVMGLILTLPVVAISENQETAIVSRCSKIKESLKEVQRTDVRARVYLGGYYDAILADYIVPFNVRMVENNLSTPELVNNQNQITETKMLFSNDFITYQQGLEELILIDCKTEPAKFYEKLDKVRLRRKTVEQDTLKMRTLISDHLRMAAQLGEKL